MTKIFLIIGIIAILVVVGLVIYCIKADLNTIKIETTDLEKLRKQKERLQGEIERLECQNQNLINEFDEKSKHLKTLVLEREITEDEIKRAKDKLHQQKIDLENEYKNHAAVIQDAYEREASRLSDKIDKEREKYRKEYLQAIEEMNADILKQSQLKIQELEDLKKKIEDCRKISLAAIEANKRQFEMENRIDFFRLNLSPEDKREIQKLRTIIPDLRNGEPVNKVIWKIYYEKPYTDLIGRVVGSKPITGIYKITNLDNGMCYVGQAVNIAERWKQHIKRGIGAEAPTRNKLYPAMLAIGVENFSFEIVEECDRSLLNEREDYWQEYFKAKEYGYSIK